MNAVELRKAWPFDGLLDAPGDMIASVPVPITRQEGLAGDVALSYLPVQKASAAEALAAAFYAGGERYPLRNGGAADASGDSSFFEAVAFYVAALKDRLLAWNAPAVAAPAVLDPTVMAAIPVTAGR
jgi:hypothetical protein